MAFSIPPHAAAGSPEDENRVLAGVKQLLSAPQDPLQAGVSHDTQVCTSANIPLIVYAGGVIHTDYALVAVYFFASLAPR